jgi:hypothetical protein
MHRPPRQRGEDQRPDLTARDRLPTRPTATEQFAEQERRIAGAVAGIAMVTTLGGAALRGFEHLGALFVVRR